jgi:hypothetical protein
MKIATQLFFLPAAFALDRTGLYTGGIFVHSSGTEAGASRYIRNNKDDRRH